jgi:hypothetical protein
MINLFSSQEFESELAEFESLPSELNAFEFAIGKLAYGVPTVPLPADLKGRLFGDLGVSEVDRLSCADIELNYPKSPLLNRPIKGDIRGATVGGKPR